MGVTVPFYKLFQFSLMEADLALDMFLNSN